MTERTLPTDSDERKEVPLYSGCLAYFPAALAGVARVSKAGNDKHNPGEALHHARGKSTDHADCIGRHLVDLHDLLAQIDRQGESVALIREALAEVSAACWRALALSQELHERFGAPLAPGAQLLKERLYPKRDKPCSEFVNLEHFVPSGKTHLHKGKPGA